MKPEELDRLLAEDADVVPSAGFVAAVMEAVTTEATAPPLTFPWTRALPLAVGFPVLLLWLAFLRVGPSTSEPDAFAWFETIVPMATAWVAGGLLMAVVMTVWSLRLVRLR